jgi:hypothetical protein
LLTNNYELDVWSKALGVSYEQAGWVKPRIDGDAGAVWSRTVNGMHVFWCRHPQGKSNKWRDGVVRHIVDTVNG